MIGEIYKLIPYCEPCQCLPVWYLGIQAVSKKDLQYINFTFNGLIDILRHHLIIYKRILEF